MSACKHYTAKDLKAVNSFTEVAIFDFRDESSDANTFYKMVTVSTTKDDNGKLSYWVDIRTFINEKPTTLGVRLTDLEFREWVEQIYNMDKSAILLQKEIKGRGFQIFTDPDPKFRGLWVSEL